MNFEVPKNNTEGSLTQDSIQSSDFSEFNWLNNDLEEEIEEYEVKQNHQSSFSICFDYLVQKCASTVLLLFILRITLFVFGIYFIKFFNSSFVTFLNRALIMSCIFLLTYVTLKTTIYVLINIDHSRNMDHFVGIYRLLSIAVWSLLSLLWFKYIKNEILKSYFVIRSILTSILVSSVVFITISVLMTIFGRYFIIKTLKLKLRDAEETENYLHYMKLFSFEEDSENNQPECDCKDAFCLEVVPGPLDEHFTRRSLEDIETQKSFIRIPEPQLYNVFNAKTLAKYVFEKSSSDSENLTFDDFCKIFPHSKIAISAFSYFDNGISNLISKKMFHDTILMFYMERVNLEKSITRAKDFVTIIENILNIIAFCFLFVVYLIIFGVPLKELLAFTLSSALALNFLASGVATDSYYNLMMLLSHQFDIGDEIIVDNVEYKVYEVGLTSTSLISENGGKIKFLNSDIWKKTLINMTRAPENVLIFKFLINPDTSNSRIVNFKKSIHEYLEKNKFNYFNNFSLQSISEDKTGIDLLECHLILKCKAFKNKAQKFSLRADMTRVIRKTLNEHKLTPKKI